MSARLPSLFIGSSSEALDFAEAAREVLREVADVTLWTDPGYKRAGEFFLDSLAAAPARFDFALLVFGHDDKVTVRGTAQDAPRDNVVFELGLFWSCLGRERTFALVPAARRNSYRILSDLQGLEPWFYTRPRSKKELAASAQTACEPIVQRIRELHRRRADDAPKAVADVARVLSELIREARAEQRGVSIHNIALDMESTWPLVRDSMLAVKAIEDVTWHSIMVDPESDSLAGLWSDTVSQDTARNSIANMQTFCASQAESLRSRRVVFECRAYAAPPTVHGFLFNQRQALFSLSGLRDGRLFGAPNPYVLIDAAADAPQIGAAEHLVQAFDSWYGYHWERSRPIWTV
jgi:hypothetical protein